MWCMAGRAPVNFYRGQFKGAGTPPPRPLAIG
jgi:hypothetical protein